MSYHWVSMIFEFASRAKLPASPYQPTQPPDLTTVIVATVPLAILIMLLLINEFQYLSSLVFGK